MNWPACQAQGSSGCRHLVPRERAPGARSLEPSSLWIGYGGAERKSQEPGAEPIHTPQSPIPKEPRTSNLEPRTSNPTSTFHLPPRTPPRPSTFPSTFHLPPTSAGWPAAALLPPPANFRRPSAGFRRGRGAPKATPFWNAPRQPSGAGRWEEAEGRDRRREEVEGAGGGGGEGMRRWEEVDGERGCG